MTHRDNYRDAQIAFGQYLGIGGAGELERDGASWRINNGPASLSRWIYGAASFVLALRAYIEGYEAARG